MLPKAYPGHISQLLLFTCRVIFARAATFSCWDAAGMEGWGGGNLLYRAGAGPRRIPQVSDTLANSLLFPPDTESLFPSHRGNHIPFLTVRRFSAGSRSNNKRAEKVIPHVEPCCFVLGREVQAFPHPQHSPPKVLLPYGKVEEPPETACRTCEALSACTTLRGAQATENLVGRGVARALRALSVPSSPWEL